MRFRDGRHINDAIDELHAGLINPCLCKSTEIWRWGENEGVRTRVQVHRPPRDVVGGELLQEPHHDEVTRALRDAYGSAVSRQQAGACVGIQFCNVLYASSISFSSCEFGQSTEICSGLYSWGEALVKVCVCLAVQHHM